MGLLILGSGCIFMIRCREAKVPAEWTGLMGVVVLDHNSGRVGSFCIELVTCAGIDRGMRINREVGAA